MRSVVAVIMLLFGYTLIYAGVSKFWFGVTLTPVKLPTAKKSGG